MANKMRPIHPGEILEGELEELDLSASAFARSISVPVNRVTSILHQKRSVTADTALRFARFFGTTPEFWLNLQIAHDLKVAIRKKGKKIQREVTPPHKAA